MTVIHGQAGTALRCDGCGAEELAPAGRWPRGWNLTDDGHRCRACMTVAGEGAPVYASRLALEQARTVMPGRCVENEVRAVVARSGVRVVGAGKAAVLGQGWRATLVRRPSTLVQGRTVWKVLEVRSA